MKIGKWLMGTVVFFALIIPSGTVIPATEVSPDPTSTPIFSKADYFVYQSFKIDATKNLLLFRDKVLKDGKSATPNFDSKPSLLRLIASDGKVLDQEWLEPYAGLSVLELSIPNATTFFMTELSEGGYDGLAISTRALSVSGGSFKWIEAKDSESGNIQKIIFHDGNDGNWQWLIKESPQSEGDKGKSWKVVKENGFETKDVLSFYVAQSNSTKFIPNGQLDQPEYQKPKYWRTHFVRYYFCANEWRYKEKILEGGIGDNGISAGKFPDLTLFPKSDCK
jgi:hypothetical protein